MALARRALALALLAALAVSACQERRRLENEMAVGAQNHEQRHPIGFTARRETLDVEVPPGAEGLSSNQHTDVYRFLVRFKHEATGRLVISQPAAVTDRASVAHSLQGIQRHVVEAGIDYRLAQGARQSIGGVPAIRIAYERTAAVAPTCDHWQEDVGRNEARVPYANFGCATQRNTAAMVDNARDLQRPQAEDPRPGERRSVGWSGYVGTPAGGKSDDGGDSAKKAAPAAAAKK
jgi:pilus assembly protein CpaD